MTATQGPGTGRKSSSCSNMNGSARSGIRSTRSTIQCVRSTRYATIWALIFIATPLRAAPADPLVFPHSRQNATASEPTEGTTAAAPRPDQNGGAAGEVMEPVQGPFRFGDWKRTIDGLTDPVAVAIGPAGNIFIAESGRGQVRVEDGSGQTLRIIGHARGPDEAHLLRPTGLAVDEDGTLFVSDAGHHNVQVFAPDGTVRAHFGGYGDGPGQFNEPRGVAIDDEHIYLVDLGNHRIQIFSRDGRFVKAFGSFGRGEGEFNRPIDVALDPDGFLYVSDSDNNRIQKFTHEGVFVTSWGDFGPFAGLMDQPSGLVFREGQLYVTDTRNHRVQIFDPEGNQLEQWGTHAVLPHEGEGALHYPTELAIAPDGASAVICETFENRCQIFTASAPGTTLPPPPPISRRAQTHFGEHLDADGQLLAVAEPDSHRLYVFEMSREIPIVIGDFGERGEGFGQMIRIAGIELDLESRTLLASDTAMRRLNAFQIDWTPDEPRGYSGRRGHFTHSYDLPRLTAEAENIETTWIIEPEAIALDADSNLYVADPRNSMILVFDNEMKPVRAWGGYGSDPGQFRRPTDLTFARDGDELYVVDADNHRVQVFDRDGNFQRAFGDTGDNSVTLHQPFGVAATDQFIYLTDSAAHQVFKYTTGGEFIATFGGFGTEHGQFWKPKGVVVDERGRLIVIDYGNHRAQIFSPEGEWLVTFGTGRAYTRWDRRRPDPGG